MSMQISDIVNDPLVQETVKVFKDAILEKYKGNDYGPTEDRLTLDIDSEHPALQALVATDSLDSVSAAVLASEHYVGWGIDPSSLGAKLNPEVADTLKMLRDEAFLTGGKALVESGNPTAIKLAVAFVTGITSGEEFEEMKAAMREPEAQMMIAPMLSAITDLAENLSESDNWKLVPPKLMDRFIESIDTLSGLVSSKTQKRVISSISQDLKTAIAKGAAAELTQAQEAAPPKIDPDSPYVQLKDKAGRLKL